MSETIYWLQCPEGQDKRRVRYLRDGDLPQFVRVMDVETGEEQVVSKNRLQLPLPGVEHESKTGDDHTKDGARSAETLGVRAGGGKTAAAGGVAESGRLAVLGGANKPGNPIAAV